MKRFSRLFALLAMLPALLASCLGDGDSGVDYTTYDDMAVASFTLGTMKRVTADTVTTITGSYYPMTIDHVRKQIYNAVELPVGTDVTKVVCNIKTYNNGVAYFRMTSDTTTFALHQNTDSVDLSQPRTLRIFALNGSGCRDYEVRLNVSKTDGTDFGWQLRSTADTGMSPDADLRLYHLGTRLVALTGSTTAPTLYVAPLTADSITWTKAAWTTGPSATAGWKGVAVADTMLYVLDGDVTNGTTLWKTADGSTWQQADHDADSPAIELVGGASHELFALDDTGQMMHLYTDSLNGTGAAHWQVEPMEYAADADSLPTQGIACISYPYTASDNTDYVLLVGSNAKAGKDALVWHKVSQYAGIGMGGQWTYMGFATNNHFRLPRQEQYSLARYQKIVLAVGNDHQMYMTNDLGITWRIPGTFALPTDIDDTTAVAMTNDADGRLWLVAADGRAWMGLRK